MKIGDIVNSQYKILDKIGIGGMSTVYLARDIKTGETVAIKVMDDKLINDSDYVLRFEREAKVGISLNHPNIANVITYGKEDDTYFIVMEYIQGITLTEYIKKKGPLPIKESLDIILQILSALSYAYSKGIQAHRDIKPGNIMIELKTNRVKVMDFGIAKTIGSSLTHSTALYTPRYASPEQLLPTKFGNRIDQRTDIYAIGIILFEMLTGKSPYSGTTPAEISEQQIKGYIPNISEIRRDIPYFLSQIILKCLQTNPNNRYQTVEELINDLKQGLSPKTTTQLEEPTKTTISKRESYESQPSSPLQPKLPPQPQPPSQPFRSKTLNKPFNLIWKYKTGGGIHSSPTIYNGKLYIGSNDYYIYCLNASDGSLIWKYKTGDWVTSTPTIYNGKLYIGSDDSYIYCLNASNGSLIWRYKTGDWVTSTPTIYNGKLYVGSYDCYIYCLDIEEP